MHQVILTTLVGLFAGGLLALANWYSPALMPWVIGFMVACLAVNLKTLIDAIERA